MNYPFRFLLLIVFLSPFSASFAQSMLKKGDKQYELHAYGLAIKSYLKVLEKDPDHVEATAKLADCYYHLNRTREAAKLYERLSEIPDIDPQIYKSYGRALMENGEYETARYWYLKYAQSYPEEGQYLAQGCNFASAQQGIPSAYEVKNEYANSSSADFGPAFFKDLLVFSSARTDIKRKIKKESEDWTGKAYNQLFKSGVDDNGYLTRPAFLKSDLSNTFNDGPVSYVSDKKLVAFAHNNFVDGTRHIPSSGLEMSIYLADVDANGDWKDAKAFPFNDSGYSMGFPCLTDEGNTLYFSSNRPDGYGGFDIFVSHKIENNWTAPENLGPSVNTSGNEITPYFDGEVLYFASDFHHGLGGFDIFSAEKNAGAWDMVFHMGSGINSPKDDHGFIFDRKRNIGYLTSNRLGGKGSEDIYRVKKNTDQIEIAVVDAISKKPVPEAVIDFSGCGEEMVQTDESGHYRFNALKGMDCEVVVRKTGFKSYSFSIQTEGLAKNENFRILLKKEGDSFYGRIVGENSKSALEDVFVRAINQNSGLKEEVFTNADGEYWLALEPQSTYIMRFSKAGYQDMNKTVKTGKNPEKDLLGINVLLSSSTQLQTPDLSTDTPAPSTSEPELVQPGSPPPSPDTEVESKVVEGYAIQLAAFSANKSMDMSRFDNLRDLGGLYLQEEKGMNKVRLGLFPEKENALAILAEIKNRGVIKAFLVHEKATTLSEKVYFGMLEKETSAKNNEKNAEPQETPKTEKSYKVRLAAYKNPENFNSSRLEGYGVIEERKHGEFTIMLISGFSSLEEASQASNYAKKLGFMSAYLVVEENGVLKRVKL